MKSPLKLVITLLAVAVMASVPSLRAQDQKNPPAEGRRGGGQRGGRGGLTIEALETAVGTLSADQKTKITAIIDKANKDRQELFSGGQPDRAKMQELQQQERKDIRAVLTEEQAKKFDAMPQPQGRGQGGGRQGGGQGGGRRGGGGGGN
jgi:Spy/CpxP family protein refolding chaperone